MFKADNLNDIYKMLASRIISSGHYLTNNTTELLNITFVLTDVDNCIITNKGKKASLKYLLAENIWYAAGSNSKDFIGKFASKWLTISDDNKTNNSAYGYIMQYKFNFNQINKIIELLKKDQNSRRACIILNDANENVDKTLDEQCTMFLQFVIRNDLLHLTVCMRSNDIIYGLPYDVPAFIAVQKYIANKLSLRCGNYTHFATSLHCYNKDLVKVYNISTADNDRLKYDIDFVMLYNKAKELFEIIDNKPNDIIDICKNNKILKEL